MTTTTACTLLIFLAVLVGALIAPPVATAQVLKLADLNTEQIRALDRDKTIVLIPGGILEQHGPYLPSFTDGYRNERATEELARAVAARPGWTALVFPTIPLGVGGANEIGGHYSFPGTYAVRSTTLRAVFVDLASELGEQGFQWIFVVHLHGAPAHSRALDEAGDYFRDTYGGRMVHLYGLMPVLAAGEQPLDTAEAAETGLDIHAGRGETSDILFIRPDLVAPGYRTAPSLPGEDFDELVRIARETDWPGYFGAPGQATAAEGKTRIEQRSTVAADFMWRIVDGAVDEREIPRYAATRPEASLRTVQAAAAEERVREERFDAWLAQRREPPQTPAQRRLPIIDMHLHAHTLDMFGPSPLGLCLPLHAQLPPLDAGRDTFRPISWDPPCTDPIWSPETDEAVMAETIELLERLNIVGVVSGAPEEVRRWHAAAPHRFVPAVYFALGSDAPSPDSLRRLFEDGPFVVLGEVANQYLGIAPDDEQMAPYWALAEELDIPVAIHLGEGPPGAAYVTPTYRARLTSPFLLEEVLHRHPRLRVYVMHYGSPLVDEMIAMLGAYPQLYVDIGGIQWAYPRPYFYGQLRKLVDAGFGKRVMFGSDQMVWPGVIEPAIAIIEEAPFLTEQQKRDIFYNNAARFLRLSDEEIARHHGRAAQPATDDRNRALERVEPNDNRSPAGTFADGVLELRLETRLAAWRPDADVDTAATVLAFAEEGGPATIPGPFLRVPQGTEVRVSVRHAVTEPVRIGTPPPLQRAALVPPAPDAPLIVHGLRAGTAADDTLHVAPGATREVRFRADRPGTYLYWGALSETPFDARTGRDTQLAGAIVVDPAGVPPDPDERVFVITVIDIFADSTGPPPYEDIFEMAINGLSWPHTERLHYAVGDTVRWRWVNASFTRHPMHLHGFHFRTLAKGDGVSDTTYAPDRTRLAVTEFMEAGSTFRMEWVPTRGGNWMFHCHFLDHVVPWPERDEAARAHDLHDVERHPLEGMAGLVLGITVDEPTATADTEPEPEQRLRLLAQERRVPGSDAVIRGFVLHEGDEPPPDSVVVPGPPLLLTRDQTTAITVVNRMIEPTTVHWHGMELESVYDGVAGWSRTGSRVAPLIAPGDSFVVYMTPPRAGTFIYHTHMDETDQLATGMYGPMLVLEPGEGFDPEHDHLFVIGEAVDGGERTLSINGRRQPLPMTLAAGAAHRIRIININPDLTADVALVRDSAPLPWRPLAHDGADLPRALRVESPARVRTGTGETYDFLWLPPEPGDAVLLVHFPFATEPGELVLRQRLRVR